MTGIVAVDVSIRLGNRRDSTRFDCYNLATLYKVPSSRATDESQTRDT